MSGAVCLHPLYCVPPWRGQRQLYYFFFTLPLQRLELKNLGIRFHTNKYFVQQYKYGILAGFTKLSQTVVYVILLFVTHLQGKLKVKQ